MRCLFLFLFLALPATAIAADAESSPSNSSAPRSIPACGATVADALKQAQRSLDANDTLSQRAALQCLIEAVAKLNSAQPIQQRDGHQTLSVPSNPIIYNVK